MANQRVDNDIARQTAKPNSMAQFIEPASAAQKKTPSSTGNARASAASVMASAATRIRAFALSRGAIRLSEAAIWINAFFILLEAFLRPPGIVALPFLIVNCVLVALALVRLRHFGNALAQPKRAA